jgi:SAM-dependent methyltransferase
VPDSGIFAEHADTYASFSEHSGPNAHYDRPAILRLAGEIAGRRVLELGCAGGALTAQLVERGADVLALDREPRLVALARERLARERLARERLTPERLAHEPLAHERLAREQLAHERPAHEPLAREPLAHERPAREQLGGQARVEVADIEQPLDVPSASIDVVVASLVLHFLEDWAPLLGELHRCLVPGGALVFSVHHPITGWLLSDQENYHRTELISEDWDWGGQRVTARMYRRPLSAIFGQLRAAGFTVDVVDEPRPVDDEPRPDAPVDPALHRILDTKPVFLFIRALRSQVR